MVATAVYAAFSGVTAPFLGLILRREFDATPFQLSLGASAAAASMLLSLAWARFASHHPPLVWVVWPTIVGRSLYLFAPLVSGAWTLTALVATSTFVSTIAGPAQTALVERLYPRGARGRALAWVRASGGVAAIGVSIAAGVALETFGYRSAFAVAGIIGVLASLALLAQRVPAIDDRPMTDTTLARRGATKATNDHGFAALMTSAFLFGLGCWIQVPARPVTLADVVRITPKELGWLGAVGGVAAIVASLSWGRLADRRSSLDVLRLVYVAGIAAIVAYFVARTPWAVVGGFAGDALLQSGLELVWGIALIDVAGPRRAAPAVALLATLAGVRGLIGPPLGAAFIASVGVSAVCVIAVSLMGGAPVGEAALVR